MLPARGPGGTCRFNSEHVLLGDGPNSCATGGPHPGVV